MNFDKPYVRSCWNVYRQSVLVIDGKNISDNGMFIGKNNSNNGMFTDRVCLSLMAIKTTTMACLQERITMNQISRDQKMRKEKYARLAPKLFWEDTDEKP